MAQITYLCRVSGFAFWYYRLFFKFKLMIKYTQSTIFSISEHKTEEKSQQSTPEGINRLLVRRDMTLHPPYKAAPGKPDSVNFRRRQIILDRNSRRVWQKAACMSEWSAVAWPDHQTAPGSHPHEMRGMDHTDKRLEETHREENLLGKHGRDLDRRVHYRIYCHLAQFWTEEAHVANNFFFLAATVGKQWIFIKSTTLLNACLLASKRGLARYIKNEASIKCKLNPYSKILMAR